MFFLPFFEEQRTVSNGEFLWRIIRANLENGEQDWRKVAHSYRDDDGLSHHVKLAVFQANPSNWNIKPENMNKGRQAVENEIDA